MKLSTLLPGAPKELAETEITRIAQDSREAGAGVLFFAVEGTNRDGHDFVADVVVKGALAVVRTGHPRVKDLDPRGLIKVADPRQTLGETASRFYGEPSRKLLVCGVTGTNGKTTSTYLLESLLAGWGQKPAVIGTVENRFGNYRIESSHTTPDARSLQAMFHNFLDRGATAVCIEVSSHALEQRRVTGTRFAAALFTNLTQDHLDYHTTMEDYFQAKVRFFLEYEVGIRAIHQDDLFGQRLIALCREKKHEVITFGAAGCNVNYGELRLSANGIEGEVGIEHNRATHKLPIRSRMLGGFNAQNIAGAIAVGLGLGIPLESISSALAKATPVPGRMETVPNSHDVTVVVDYAHTPDALENALKTLRALRNTRLICVFGCGGDRDPGKRPVMGEIAERLADIIFITSDNPRTENPEDIIDEVMTGLKHPSRAKRVSDRRAAIAQSISILKAGDILLIAGKGHEDYQIIGTEKLPFDDRAVALENL